MNAMSGTEHATWPTNPIAAVTHPNPAPYYQHLATLPLHFDNELRCWIAASSRTVRAVLACESLRVRPPQEPVPANLVDTVSGDLFSRLARMNDGDTHRKIRTMIDQVIASISSRQLERMCHETATNFLATQKHTAVEWMFEYPTQVLATILELEPHQLNQTVHAGRLIANGFAPGGANIDIAELNAAVNEILSTIHNSHLTALARGLLDNHHTADANLVGWFFQLFDSTAGLIGNSLITASLSEPTAKPVSIVDATLRSSPPIQNTRRFAHSDTTIDDEQIRNGETVLVVLASALPDSRSQCRDNPITAFGFGPHQCPAEHVAVTIANHALKALIKLGHHAELTGYLPSLNARIPTFHERTNHL